jgi:hypothetical protein
VDLQTEINQRIDAFVAEITELARRQALETMADAIGGRALGAVGGRRKASGTIAPARAARAKGEKRPAAEIAATVDRLLGAVGSEPGMRIEQIARAMGSATRELTLPMRKLIADGRVRSEGERRATRYFPGSGDGAPTGRRRRRKRR